jgi:hypothetical protein
LKVIFKSEIRMKKTFWRLNNKTLIPKKNPLFMKRTITGLALILASCSDKKQAAPVDLRPLEACMPAYHVYPATAQMRNETINLVGLHQDYNIRKGKIMTACEALAVDVTEAAAYASKIRDSLASERST